MGLFEKSILNQVLKEIKGNRKNARQNRKYPDLQSNEASDIKPSMEGEASGAGRGSTSRLPSGAAGMAAVVIS